MRWSRSIVPARVGWFAALAVGLSLPQPSGRAQESPPRTAEGPASADVITQYRFSERYQLTGEQSRLDAIGPYRVAIRETIKTVVEKPQAAPDRDEWTTRAIFIERPAELSDATTVSAAVRRYELYQEPADPAAKPSRTRPLQGLTLWYQPRPHHEPLILSLTPGRGLWEDEYTIASQQLFLPELSALLPLAPRRVGERWSINATAARALLGESPGRGETLVGTVQEVRKGVRGSNWEAVFGVSGRVMLPAGETKVNAQVLFQFPPPPPPDPALARSGRDVGMVDVHGAILEVRMALMTTAALPEGEGRLRQITTREVVLGRQLTIPDAPPIIPRPTPTPTEENSWLTFDDPLGRFHFRHPQNFRLVPPPDDRSVILRDSRSEWPDNILIKLLPKDEPQQRDPEFHRKQLNEAWGRLPAEVIRGPSEWLPEADWAESQSKVYRIEAAVTNSRSANRGPRRIHADFYLVLSARNEGLFVTATTAQDPPVPFRDQVEAILKTFRFVPAEPAQTRE